MKLTFGSKRADIAREFFYWITLLRAFDKLDNATYGLLVGAIIGGYFAVRGYTDVRGNKDEREGTGLPK